jgi:hypothetical protein
LHKATFFGLPICKILAKLAPQTGLVVSKSKGEKIPNYNRAAQISLLIKLLYYGLGQFQ